MINIEMSVAAFLVGLAVGGFFAGIAMYIYFLRAYSDLDAVYQVQLREWLYTAGIHGMTPWNNDLLASQQGDVKSRVFAGERGIHDAYNQ